MTLIGRLIALCLDRRPLWTAVTCDEEVATVAEKYVGSTDFSRSASQDLLEEILAVMLLLMLDAGSMLDPASNVLEAASSVMFLPEVWSHAVIYAFVRRFR